MESIAEKFLKEFFVEMVWLDKTSGGSNTPQWIRDNTLEHRSKI